MNEVDPDLLADKAHVIGQVIDCLVKALGNEPSCPLRRAIVFIDIDQNPGTTQKEIMDRVDIDKSSLNRAVEWLFDYGCVIRREDEKDARSIQLFSIGYAKTHLEQALDIFKGNHENLKDFLKQYINIFRGHKPTLRDARIVATIGEKEEATRQEVYRSLYGGSPTTNNRAINNLIVNGVLEKADDD